MLMDKKFLHFVNILQGIYGSEFDNYKVRRKVVPWLTLTTGGIKLKINAGQKQKKN